MSHFIPANRCNPSLARRRHDIERHREDRIDEDHQRADEPCRAAAGGDEGRRDRRNHHHGDGPRPELQVHRLRSHDIAEQHQRGRDEQRDLRGAAERDADGHVEPVLACRGEGHRKFGGGADQRDDDEADKGRAHPEGFRGLLHRFHEDFADQRDQHRDDQQRAHGQPDRPVRLVVVAVIGACEQFLVRHEREQQAERVSGDQQD